MAAKKETCMSNEEYSNIIAMLGTDVVAMGKFLRIGERTSYRYANDPEAVIPGTTADLLRLLLMSKITMAQIEAIRPPPKKPKK